MPDYPDLAKSERKDALVPDPQEYDLSDPDRADEADAPTLSAKDRLDLFERLVNADAAVAPIRDTRTRATI